MQTRHCDEGGTSEIWVNVSTSRDFQCQKRLGGVRAAALLLNSGEGSKAILFLEMSETRPILFRCCSAKCCWKPTDLINLYYTRIHANLCCSNPLQSFSFLFCAFLGEPVKEATVAVVVGFLRQQWFMRPICFHLFVGGEQVKSGTPLPWLAIASIFIFRAQKFFHRYRLLLFPLKSNRLFHNLTFIYFFLKLAQHLCNLLKCSLDGWLA